MLVHNAHAPRIQSQVFAPWPQMPRRCGRTKAKHTQSTIASSCRSHQFPLSPRRCATRAARPSVRMATKRITSSCYHSNEWQNPTATFGRGIQSLSHLEHHAPSVPLCGRLLCSWCFFECCVYRTSAFETGLSCLCQGLIPSDAQSCAALGSVVISIH